MTLERLSRAKFPSVPVANDAREVDPYVSRALDAMRAAPSRSWTVADLARIAGLSRAAFARRFTHALGVSPLRWLTEHRLDAAKMHLSTSNASLAEIASAIGYVSEFAFAKAFKRLHGVAPGVFRRRVRVERSFGTFRAAA